MNVITGTVRAASPHWKGSLADVCWRRGCILKRIICLFVFEFCVSAYIDGFIVFVCVFLEK